jgi:hypothetical protein
MAGGQHDAQVRAELAGQEGDRGRGDHTQPQHIDPHLGQARDHRCFEELP